MKTLAELQKDYAELIVKSGLNIQKGQRLVLACPVSEAFFARLCAKAAYEVGCKEVIMTVAAVTAAALVPSSLTSIFAFWSISN